MSPVQKLASIYSKPEASVNLQSSLNVSVLEQLYQNYSTWPCAIHVPYITEKNCTLQNNEADHFEKWKWVELKEQKVNLAEEQVSDCRWEDICDSNKQIFCLDT